MTPPQMHTIPHLNHPIPEHLMPALTSLALWGIPISHNRLIDFLNAPFFEGGQKHSPTTIKSVLNELMALGCVNYLPGIGYLATDETTHAILLDLHTRKRLLAWIHAAQEFLNKNKEYATWANPTSEFCQREMLFAALSSNLPKFGQWRSQFFSFQNKFEDLVAQKLFSTSAGPVLFEQIPSNLQGLLLFDLFSAANWMLEECVAAYQYAKAKVETLFKNDFMLMDVLCIQALLRGESLTELIHYVGHESYPEAILKLLGGEFYGSAEMFSSIQTTDKKAGGKRSVFIPDIPGIFYTIAQLANNTPRHLKLAKDQCETGGKLTQSQFYPAISPLIEHLLQGTPAASKAHSMDHQSLDNVFVQLANYWQNIPPTNSDRHNLYLLFSQSQQNGYDWIAAELDQLRHNQFDESLDLPEWHSHHQFQPLCNLLVWKREESWQRALSALAKLKGPTQQGSDTRIAWFIECEPHYVNLEPREQKRGAKGVWSKGRPVALKRLSYEQDSLPGILEQDKKIASCIRKSYDNYYGASDYELDGDKALPFLIGHPAVFWLDAPDVQIDIVKGEPALAMQQKGDQISLQLEPVMHVDQPVVWQKQTPTRLSVYPNTPEIKQISSIIGKGLSVPSNAKEQLVKVIAAIAPHLAIHSDLPELAQHMDSIPVDTTLYAHLLPLKEGLRVQFLMRPLPEGSWLAPGKGSPNVVGEHQGKAIQTHRDLEQEQAQLNTLLNHCPVLTEAERQGQEWKFTHPETCLELLSQLNTYKSEAANKLVLIWPEGERFRIKSTRSAGNLRLTIKKQGDWFVAGGEVKLDDGQVIALRELLKLASSTTGRFLPLGENNFLELTESFKKRLSELNALSDTGGKDGVRINHLAAPILAEMADEVGDLKSDAAWKAQVKKFDELASYSPTVPSTLQATLRDYQLEGYQWLSRLAHWGVGACLADDMGLGKTVQTLAVLLERALEGPALVVAPVSVAMNWQSETARFAPTLRVRNYNQHRSLDELGAFDLVIVSYGMLQQDADAFAEINWHTAVLDEAQVIKNAATKRSQAAMRLKANFRLIATGTPVENHLGELWNLFHFVNPGLLGTQDHFVNTFSNPIERGDKPARHYLKRLIQPFILRRTKTQVLSELPARTEIVLQVELSEQERHMYEALRQDALTKIAKLKSNEGKSMQVLAEITRLRRFCCNPKLVLKNSDTASSKLAVFAEVVEELLDNNHKALVFSQFVDHLAIVRDWLEEKGISYQYLDGSTSQTDRQKRVEAFQAGSGDVFLISLKAGGTGLNLTAADYVIHLDPWWNPAVEDQASDRAHRMGQLRPVTIYRLVTQQTIEDQIIALHAQKRELADSLLEGGDVSAKLDAAALLRLLKGM